jgi:hypothetical protein
MEGAGPKPAPALVTASAALAQFLLNRFHEVSAASVGLVTIRTGLAASLTVNAFPMQRRQNICANRTR